MSVTLTQPRIAARLAKPRSRSSALRLLVALALVSIGTLPATLTEPLAAQVRGTQQRIVHGKVEDKGGAGIKGAVVYLRDTRSSTVKSAIADDDGGYRFVQLSPSTDYELWAQVDSKKSATKAISSFDSKNDITIMLKIDN